MRNLIIIFLVPLYNIMSIYGQQDPHYTQYMYNTMSVNPAYAGSLGHTVINALGRMQWMDIPGAPRTQTLSYETPIDFSRLGLGVNIVNDKIGPSQETSLDLNLSYAIQISETGKLAMGLKLGGRLFNVDWSKSIVKHPKDRLLVPINNKILPTIGAGIYYYTSDWYIGLSTPNFLRTDHYDDNTNQGVVSEERMHFFLIGGKVFQLSDQIKLKPAFLFKGVKGAPISMDLSLNLHYNSKLITGVSWRWKDTISTLIGFQITKQIQLGYAYDLSTSNYRSYNSGTHEIMLRYELFRLGSIVSPRFF